MKIRKRAASLKTTASKIQITLTTASEEILSMLVGMEIFWGESPQVYVAGLPDETKHTLLSVLHVGGYVSYAESDWQFTEKTYEKLANQLRQMPKMQRLLFGKTPEPEVSLRTLLHTFKAAAKQALSPDLRTGEFVTRPAPNLRMLAQKHGAQLVNSRLFDYFKHCKLRQISPSNSDFSAFLKTPNVSKFEW